MSGEPEDDSKTEQPTEKKLREAVERGNLPTSREAPLFGFLIATLLACTLMLRDGATRLLETLSRLLDSPGDWTLRNGGDAAQLMRAVLESAATFLGPFLLLFICVGLGVSFAQNAPRLVLSRIAPNFAKLSPASGLKRLFGREGLVEFAKSFAKVVAIAGIVALLMNAQRNLVIDAIFTEPVGIPEQLLSIFVRLLTGVCTAFALLAAIDLVWSRVSWTKRLMMSRREVKDEMRQAEGDPLFKARRRSLMLDRSRRRMLRDVSRATMVIANPTHYAIALRYVRSETPAPIVVAKGQDLIALKIREIAENNNIAVIEDKLLARSMYDHVEVSKAIPPAFYKAVAEIVHFIQARNTKKASVDPTRVLR
jgi:flagellar biosynthetic protein FlhB